MGSNPNLPLAAETAFTSCATEERVVFAAARDLDPSDFEAFWLRERTIAKANLIATPK
jgi:hypothetical protein